MDPERNERSELERIAIRVGIYLGVFLAGGLIAFSYSFIPLHGAKNWKIDYLETRLEAKDESLRSIQEAFAAIESEAAGKPDTQTFKLLQDELASSDKTIKNLERDLSRANRQIKELERSRSSWKARHAKAEAERDQLESAASAPGPATGPAMRDDPAEAAGAPAAPAPADGTSGPADAFGQPG